MRNSTLARMLLNSNVVPTTFLQFDRVSTILFIYVFSGQEALNQFKEDPSLFDMVNTHYKNVILINNK